MKKLLVVLFAFFEVTICRAQNIRSIAIGSSVPMADTKMKDISGKGVSIKDATRRSGVLVIFSCNTCPYVIRNQSRTKMLAAYAKQNDIGVILVNSNEGGRSEGDSFSAMQAYAKMQGYDFYYVMDTGSTVADAFGATRTPEVYLFDAKGILQYKGAIDDNPGDARMVKRAHSREAISEMISGKTISVKESRSMGCAIKRILE